MPQLSLETFITQYFWFIIILFIFYLFIYVLILPKISFTYKLRKKLTKLPQEKLQTEAQEESKIISAAQTQGKFLEQGAELIKNQENLTSSITNNIKSFFKTSIKNNLKKNTSIKFDSTLKPAISLRDKKILIRARSESQQKKTQTNSRTPKKRS